MLQRHDDLPTQEMATNFLAWIQTEAYNMSDDALRRMEVVLSKTTTHVRAVMNSRLPIFGLPTEVLEYILQCVLDTPSSDYPGEPFWYTSTVNIAMIIPSLHTCRRLRQVVQSSPNLWSSGITNNDFMVSGPSHMFSLSGNLPLDVCLNLHDHGPFAALDSRLVYSRIRELNLRFAHNKELSSSDPLFQHPLPHLKTLSVHAPRRRTKAFAFPLFQDGRISHIHHLFLNADIVPSACFFPNITHLALWDISTPDLHTEIVKLLSHCPSLISLTLRDLDDIHPPPTFSTNPPRLALSKLQRIRLDYLPMDSQALYLDILPKPRNPYLLQILAVPIAAFEADPEPPEDIEYESILTQHTRGRVTTLYIGTQTASSYKLSQDVLGVAWISAESTVHITTCLYRDPARMPEQQKWLNHVLADKASLTCVREAWIVNVPDTGYGSWCRFYPQVRRALASLPALEVVSVVVDLFRHSDGAPSLANLPICPFSHGLDSESSFRCRRLKTVRIVLGYHAAARSSMEMYGPFPWTINFEPMLEQLSWGMFDYLDNLVIRAAPCFVEPDEVDMGELRKHFRSVTFEVTEDPPMMPLPDYCVEPEAWPGQRWEGAFH